MSRRHWNTKFEMCTLRYTTHVSELPAAHASGVHRPSSRLLWVVISPSAPRKRMHQNGHSCGDRSQPLEDGHSIQVPMNSPASQSGLPKPACARK
ncbi:hypothetical protein [Methylobacterium fujisawaense]|uniref:hypothetical protein n=1 Tax=Methylobacterium fujisawaense TaxID=107400 RepID=UPI003F503D4B